MSQTADRLVEEARRLIIDRGYNGFSYADLAAALGIRKASIHHHFPAKTDLVVAVVDKARQAIEAQIATLEAGAPVADERLAAYTGYWKQCILEQSAPFCLAGVLAAELPGLPPEIGVAVGAHFNATRTWLERILTLGARQGSMRLEASPGSEADIFLAGVYGAMLSSRAFNDPGRFGVIVDAFIRRLSVTQAPAPAPARG